MKLQDEEFLGFMHFYQKIQSDFLGIADFECLSHIPSNKKIGKKTTTTYVETTTTRKKAVSCGFTMASQLENILKSSWKRYFGEFWVKKIVEFIKALGEEMRPVFKRNMRIKLNEEDQENFKNAEMCWLCE